MATMLKPKSQELFPGSQGSLTGSKLSVNASQALDATEAEYPELQLHTSVAYSSILEDALDQLSLLNNIAADPEKMISEEKVHCI